MKQLYDQIFSFQKFVILLDSAWLICYSYQYETLKLKTNNLQELFGMAMVNFHLLHCPSDSFQILWIRKWFYWVKISNRWKWFFGSKSRTVFSAQLHASSTLFSHFSITTRIHFLLATTCKMSFVFYANLGILLQINILVLKKRKQISF